MTIMMMSSWIPASIIPSNKPHSKCISSIFFYNDMMIIIMLWYVYCWDDDDATDGCWWGVPRLCAQLRFFHFLKGWRMANASAEVIHTRQHKMKIAWIVSEKEDIFFICTKKSCRNDHRQQSWQKKRKSEG